MLITYDKIDLDVDYECTKPEADFGYKGSFDLISVKIVEFQFLNDDRQWENNIDIVELLNDNQEEKIIDKIKDELWELSVGSEQVEL